ncbi:MAG: Ribosomal protein L6P, archaea [Candidatus Syntrophoarchaeum caldarius]|uniref:Large ribosomal subunit protein uL6 n=1 Tax=Candidatus Syntropharchaeum caldarium TaxID=1838285 RepID=A0A1F2PC82_9EURY|nr:MAG: Ribosomal protein L6P, archaea [Candidatus Syntrophoarchaeum caldarius]
MYTKEIEIPDDVKIEIDRGSVKVARGNTEITRELWHPAITITQHDNIIEVATKKNQRNIQALAKTFASHIQNMIEGVTNGFEYRMKVVYSHFPIQLKVEKDHLLIENFLGERSPRKAKIMEGVTVKISGTDLIITGANKEAVGQTAANIEQATRIKRRDQRVFQDGVYIVSKAKGEAA